MRRILSAVLSVVCTVSLALPAFAEELPGESEPDRCCSEQVTFSDCSDSETYTETNRALSASEEVNSQSDKDVNNDNYPNIPDGAAQEDSFITDTVVAIMYLCVSGPHTHYIFGHTWICIKNISEDSLTVGERIITPGEMASFGLHHFDGMHYDDEMYDYSGENVKALEYKLTRSDLDSAKHEITNSRWHWYEYFAHNCTNFATSVWNKVTGRHFFAFCFPFIVQIQMAGSGLINIIMSCR